MSPKRSEIRPVKITDLQQLDALEQASFDSDRLSQRRLKHWIKAENRVFLVAMNGDELLGYGLVLLHSGTQLARLYSLAVSKRARGQGIGRKLLAKLEEEASQQKKLYMRLEVATDNEAAIALYQSVGYTSFRWLPDYYEDHRNALRMQKRIRYVAENLVKHRMPWYQQQMDFSCGPAALMMAMKSLSPKFRMNLEEEINIWREATTVYMTTGHGGTHPLGLGLAAQARGFHAEVFINQDGPLFIESVRTEHKKEIITAVDQQFRKRARKQGVRLHHKDVSQNDIEKWLGQGRAVLILISTYRIDGTKAPHWVVVSAIDDACLYVHDPDPPHDHHNAYDCQYVPIARSDFAKMSSFGRSKLRTCVLLWPLKPDQTN
jgi:ribosomal protein S18 acetylase RimI-like enzyme/predicted double-glycine peptidase